MTRIRWGYRGSLFVVILLVVLALTPVTAMGDGETELLASEEYQGVEEIVVETDSFDVNVVGTRTSRTVAEVHGSPQVDVRIVRRGDRVVIEAKERRALFSRSTVPGRIDIQAFEGSRLDIEIGSGNADIRGFQGGEVNVRTGSGSIVARAIFGETDLRTGSGEIEMERLGGTVEVGSGSGALRLEDGEGRILLNSSSGEVQLRRVSGVIEAASTSGRVELREGEGTFRLASTSGDVRGEGLLLRGDSQFRSVSGSIQLDFTDGADAYGLELRTVSGSIRVERERVGSRYSRDGGRYLVEASSTSGSITVE